jgi:hypothetical protein
MSTLISIVEQFDVISHILSRMHSSGVLQDKVLPAGWNGNTMYNESANIEIIRNTRESIKRSFDLVQSAREEVLRIFSSITAFRRQVRVGVLHLFKESIQRGVKVRVLIPADCQQIRQIINEVNLVLPDLSIRCVDKSLQNAIGILVIDRKESLIVETKDDT